MTLFNENYKTDTSLLPPLEKRENMGEFDFPVKKKEYLQSSFVILRYDIKFFQFFDKSTAVHFDHTGRL